MSDLGSEFESKRGTLSSFGERLRGRRDFLGITQGELVKKSGISLASIQSYERGNIPKGDYLLTLSEVLECSVDWLLKGETPKQYFASSPPQSAESVLPPAPPPEDEFKMSDMLTMTAEVLESDTIYRTALASNVRAFHQAVRSERTLVKLEERVASLEAREERWSQIEARMADLERENAELKRRLERHDENTAKAVGD